MRGRPLAKKQNVVPRAPKTRKGLARPRKGVSFVLLPCCINRAFNYVCVRVNELTVQALRIFDVPQVVLNVGGLTPNDALKHLRNTIPKDEPGRLLWHRQARIAAIVGSCPKTRGSMKSGIKNWIEFAEVTLGGKHRAFPPALEDVLVWSNTFRCVGTFSNYLGFLRTACLALDIEPVSASHPALQRAKVAIVKRMLWTPRWALVVFCGLRSFLLHLVGQRCFYNVS